MLTPSLWSSGSSRSAYRHGPREATRFIIEPCPINIDNKLDAATLQAEGVQIPFIGPDNRAGARLAGDHLAKSLQAGDEEVPC